jgi:hypothetical protein
MNFWMIFLVIVCKKYLNFPQCITLLFLFIIEYIWKFEIVHIPYRFNVSFWKMIKILSHNQKLNFHILWFYYTLSYNFSSYIMYIITHLYVIKNSWSSEILKQFWNILWIFKVLKFHIFKSMCFLNVANMFLSSIFFSMKILLLYESFW